MARVRDKDSRVPVEFTTLHKHGGKLAFGFLRKRLDTENVGLATRFAQLDIAIAWLRTGRTYAHSQQYVILGHVAETCLQTALELLFVHHHLVGRRNHDVGIGVDTLDAHISPCHAGGCITMDRLHQDTYVCQFGQLLLHQMQVILTRTHIYVFCRQQASKSVIGNLQLSTTSAEKIQELLWIVLPAYRPQPSTHAASKDNAVILIADFHVISRIDLKSRCENTKIIPIKQEKARKIHIFKKNSRFMLVFRKLFVTLHPLKPRWRNR